MLGHFRDSWQAIKRRGLDLDREQFFQSRAEITRVTLAGEYVKSYGERLIANTLFEHDVDYRYERNLPRGGFNYRPDFTVLAEPATVIIEYFGVQGDPAYLANAETRSGSSGPTNADVMSSWSTHRLTSRPSTRTRSAAECS